MGVKLLHSRRTVGPQALIRAFGLALALLLWPRPSAGEALPDGFVFLHEVDASILQDIRYAGRFNFTGAALPGYAASRCILHRRAADSLAKAQAKARENGVLLKVLDCYRPHKATQAFTAWVKSPETGEYAREFHPSIDKAELMARKFISANSTHSLGIAVDVTLVRSPDGPARTKAPGGGPCNGPFDTRPMESDLDFGTTFDCFAPESQTQYKGVSKEARRNRALLVTVMKSGGFENYSREWWHFQLGAPPAGLKPQDFDIAER